MRGELRPGGTEREWCDPEVLRRLRRASLAVLRKEIEAADQRALATFLPSWQGVDRHPPAGAGVDRLREVLVPLQGLALPAEVWERDVLPRRVGAYSPAWLDQLCASGEVVWVGAGALGRRLGRVALYFRDDAEAIGPPPPRPRSPRTPEHELLRERAAGSPCFFTDLLAELPLAPEQIAGGALGPRLGGRGDQRRVGAAARAAAHASPAARPRDRARGRALRRAPRRRAAATRPGPLVADRARSSAPRPSRARGARTLAELLLERYGIVTREQVLAEGIPGGFSIALRRAQPARDARRLPPRLLHRGPRRRAVRAARRGRAPARAARRGGAADRARRHRPGPALRRRAAVAAPRIRAPARVRGAYVVLRGAEPVVYVESGGKGLLTSHRRRAPAPALEALAHVHHRRPRRRLSLERVNGEPVVGSAWEACSSSSASAPARAS